MQRDGGAPGTHARAVPTARSPLCLQRSPAELSSTYRKVHEIDRHLGIAVAGLVADGRILSRFMRNETINHKFVFESPMPVGRLVRQVGERTQPGSLAPRFSIHRHGRMAGPCFRTLRWRTSTRSARCDRGRVPTARASWSPGTTPKGPTSSRSEDGGCSLFPRTKPAPLFKHSPTPCLSLTTPQTQPDANFFEWHAIAIGARSQAAKTYLEKNFESFAGLSLDDLIVHGLKAIQGSVADGELTAGSCTVAWVGEGQDFTIAEGPKLEPFIARVRQGEREGAAAGEGQAEGGAAGQGPAAAEGGADEGQRMDTD